MGLKKEIPAGIIDKICIHYQAGKSVYMLSRYFGISRYLIESALKSRGIENQAWYDRLPYVQEIIEEYKQGFSLKKIGKRYGYSQGHVTRVLIDAGLAIRNARDQRLLEQAAGRLIPRSGPITATIKGDVAIEGGILELITGLLLGDGSIRLKNGPPILCVTNKSWQYLNFIASRLATAGMPSRIVQHNKRGHFKLYTRGWLSLGPLAAAWYGTGSKKCRIPDQLQLSPEAALHWYLGDGSLCKHRYKRPTGALYTNCFPGEDVRRLCNALKMVGIPALAHRCGGPQRHQWRISLNRKGIIALINYIGPCPVADYAYKWDIHTIYRPQKPAMPSSYVQISS